jgi:hypothetical protein
MEIILIFLRHYLFCSIGAFFRFMSSFTINLIKKQPINSFKSFWDYKTNPQNELKDAFIGFIFIGILLSVIL